MDMIEPISEVRSNLPDFVTKVGKGGKHLVITRNGKAAAVMISPEELETLEIKADKNLLLSIARAQEDFRRGKVFSHEDVFADV